MQPFSFATTAQILCESGSATRLAELCREREARRVLVVTDPGITRLGMLDPILPGFAAAGLAVEVFDQVQADPPEAVVLQAVDQAKALRAELVIGFGGGSSMDVAKLVALLAHPACGQELQDLYGVGNARGRRLPLIQVPTTAGTGSEVTPIAIVTTGETTKLGVVSPLLLPDLALLDADLTLGLPAAVTAATGIDAMVHAIEAYTSRHKKNPLSDLLAREALRLLCAHLDEAVHNGRNREARQAMLLGACLAGQAFANAPVAAVHALAYPLAGTTTSPRALECAGAAPRAGLQRRGGRAALRRTGAAGAGPQAATGQRAAPHRATHRRAGRLQRAQRPAHAPARCRRGRGDAGAAGEGRHVATAPAGE